MANGKIIYTPALTYGIQLDGAHHLSLDSSKFNFGTGNFAVDALFQVDADISVEEVWLAAKGAVNLSGVAGWHFFYNPVSKRLGMRINDGGVVAQRITTVSNVFSLGSRLWARAQVDRSGTVDFYLNGIKQSILDGSATLAPFLTDGFEDGTLNAWDGHSDSPPTVSSTYFTKVGLCHLACFQGDGPNQWISRSFAALDALEFKCWVRFDQQLPTVVGFAQLLNASGAQITFTRNSSTKKISVRLGDHEGTVIGTGTTSIESSTWYYLEGQVTISNSGGNIRLEIDSVSDIDLSGLDTQYQATNGVTTFKLGSIFTGWQYSVVLYFDEVQLTEGASTFTMPTGSLDNTENLKIGGSGSGHYHKGIIDFIRFDTGRLLPAAWHTEEWARIRYGWPRTDPQDFLAFWTFNQSLVDISETAYLLAYQASGIPTYVTGYPYAEAPISYTFGISYNWGHEAEFLDLDGIQRALDGTLYLYRAGRKKRYNLTFECTQAQTIALLAAWVSGYVLKFYENVDYPQSCRCNIVSSPKVKSLFVNYNETTVELEEA